MSHINAGKYPKDEINRTLIDYLSSLMQLQDMEKQYIDEFFRGNYSPCLLFEEEIANKLLSHPITLRTQ